MATHKCIFCGTDKGEIRVVLWYGNGPTGSGSSHLNVCRDCYLGPFWVLLPLAWTPAADPTEPSHSAEI